MKKKILIIGGGPAGLTSALELARKEAGEIILFERESQVGGISRTLMYKGNRIDIGGHRFFSKSEEIMKWWSDILPLQGQPSRDDVQLKRTVKLTPSGPDPEKSDLTMLVRSRLSRILFSRKFFSYPVTLSFDTIKNLGITRVIKMGFSYFLTLFHKRQEKSLEDFFINRFGKELYNTFFKDYTEKVWGVPCNKIGADWGAQRVKGLSILKVLQHALRKLVFWKKFNKQGGETSLIEEFWYPKFGPGQLWETVASAAEKHGVQILLQHDVEEITMKDSKISHLCVRNLLTGELKEYTCDCVISTTSVQEFTKKIGQIVPENIKKVAEGLMYRDFITVGILLNKLQLKSKKMNTSVGEHGVVPDNWIYVQEPDVKVGRLQIFNNWSPYLVQDPGKTWIGMEYFVNEGDNLWNMNDQEFCLFAEMELEKIGVIDKKDVVDHCVFRIQKAYPAYFGSYHQFDVIKKWLDSIVNLYPIGRNGMHRYNNMDHSMLSAMEAVNHIVEGSGNKASIWEINADKEYHESK